MYGPLIAGDRFQLRAPHLEEAGAALSWFGDLKVTAYTLLRYPPSLEAERDWLKQTAADPNWILWAIEHESRLVGVTSIGPIDWANQHGTTGTLIGDRTAWGKGIGGEVMKRRADFAFTQTTLRKLVSGYIEGNEASRRAQASAGYREIGRQRQHHFREGRWLDHIITELHREDWEAARR